ncbi:MAG: cupredoxin domain-containing protein [Nitrospirota bacterium]|nr:MAG: cupredoxin domain-containing protein [Nitrospirota bacterium]
MFKVKMPSSVSPFKYKLSLLMLLVALMLHGWMALAATSVHQIRITHHAPFFSPKSVSVVSGTIIRWVNETNEIHTILADECSMSSSCRVNSGVIRPHDSFNLSRLPPGRYAYHCGLHPFMRGTITILTPQSNSTSI